MISKKDLDADPILQFRKWYEEALKSGGEKVDAFALATSDKNGKPSVRMLLFKGLNAKGFRFFTNFESAKAEDLKANPQASMLFFWNRLVRQIRIDGVTERLSTKEEDEYWISRPRGSQIGAHASPQSREVESREFLEKRFSEVDANFLAKEIPRPVFWGGYVLIPEKIEFWEGLQHRLHDRILYTKIGNKWNISRLAP